MKRITKVRIAQVILSAITIAIFIAMYNATSTEMYMLGVCALGITAPSIVLVEMGFDERDQKKK